MGYMRAGGLGDARPLVSDKNSIRVDAWYCNPWNPAALPFFNTPLCVPTEADIEAWQKQQLATTRQTPANQQTAVDLANAAMAADREQEPGMYAQLDSVAQSPWLSQIFSPGVVASTGGPSGIGVMVLLASVAVIGLGSFFGKGRR